jgi:hypothetical protein
MCGHTPKTSTWLAKIAAPVGVVNSMGTSMPRTAMPFNNSSVAGAGTGI